MWKRTVLAAAVACMTVAGVQAQENATVVLRSGDKVTGQMVDMGGAGFTMRVSGQERQIPTNDVAVIDFNGNGDLSDEDWAKVGSGQLVWLRNGDTINGRLYDIAGTNPLRITLKTDSGDRQLSSSEIGRIVLGRTNNAVATSGSARSLGIPEGSGLAVSGTQAWTPTGITVRRGETLTVSATGEVRMSADANDLASPNGSRAGRLAPSAPIPQVPAGALIARVGNSEPFPLGEQLTVTMPAAGQLFLGINDDHTGDNQGGFRVNLQRSTRR